MTPESGRPAPAGWDDMRRRILTRVFYDHSEADVSVSRDLLADGFLDSMSVLVILGLFDDELGEGVAMRHARIPDTANLDAMGAFYRSLLEQR